jgi:hypothetical protein
MFSRIFPTLAVMALAGTLWVVPSIGSQGMGTIGERFHHSDRGLVRDRVDDSPMRAALLQADSQVEAALVVSHPVD